MAIMDGINTDWYLPTTPITQPLSMLMPIGIWAYSSLITFRPVFKRRLSRVKLEGLDPHKKYLVKEINLMPHTESTFAQNGKVFSGDYLMKVGLDVFSYTHNTSMVIEITAK